MNRRSFISAAAATPLAALPAIGTTVDPLPEMVTRWFEIKDEWMPLEENSSEEKAVWAKREKLGLEICTTKATSAEGVAAQIKYALDDFEGNITGNVGDDLDVKLFDSVLAGLDSLGLAAA